MTAGGPAGPEARPRGRGAAASWRDEAKRPPPPERGLKYGKLVPGTPERGTRLDGRSLFLPRVRKGTHA